LARNCFRTQGTAAMNSGPRYNERQPDNSFKSGTKSELNPNVTAQKEATNEKPSEIVTCRAHNRDRCGLCFNCPVQKCNALSTELEFKCGCFVPVIADACRLGNEKMPVCEGKMGDKTISVLRYTGCPTVVVKRDLVTDDQLTGNYEVCALIDGTIRHTTVAEIEIDMPYYKSKVRAVCTKELIYDAIVGNVEGVINQEDIFEAQAVTTRSQAKKGEKPSKRLKVIDELRGDITRDGLVAMQQQDVSLQKFLKEAQQGQMSDESEVYFQMKNGILHRYCRNFEDRRVSQIVVPVGLREKVLKMAHEAVISGHQGRKKTKDRIWREFWWPGLGADVTRFCRSCDICQRTIAKGRVPNVPLGKMPITDTPFDRVAVDIVGPISPATKRGNRYILTMVDYATRNPEAVELKDS